MAFFIQKVDIAPGLQSISFGIPYRFWRTCVTKLHTTIKYISKIVKWVIVSRGVVASVISKMGFALWVLLVKLQT
jgi:hypothetical protein